ncbi:MULTISPECIES: hypothetical protein [Okeania]|uniref:Uncharacterized protein n=1 Tax=Okeania hirsuta TaxID=1458930 RepID=A0A3N6N9C0_9CYAN|nr:MULTISPECIES: hypothetical protein [Okeania]NET16567.1 hypothetical protein [Okeania sp. SIO1H6]NEP96172.1 hypothetical protein [Okeania sp. SIO2F5]NES77809.1 hypothetical protein [Okeania sp. SIO1H4]NES92635.1 hypothetical protein [Okeania sp. SIO2B9]NET22809.1 hypothetical protein [Okeania sp. SIO1H5]
MSKGRSQETGDRRQEEWGMSEKAGVRIIPQFLCPNLAVNTNFLRLFNSNKRTPSRLKNAKSFICKDFHIYSANPK